ncbi:hypothetical protein MRB53_000635 [Persea americana]|uniref:Uncharacterized protein n=1 Tax=Persea americana TaxID=3435 RepID=A0ACC2MRS5_PERAE|nr:hypothetical protein MRB53_000635 [Persea americana]
MPKMNHKRNECKFVQRVARCGPIVRGRRRPPTSSLLTIYGWDWDQQTQKKEKKKKIQYSKLVGRSMKIESQGGAHGGTPRPFSNGREDCWSEDATSALVEAWGDRYLLLNRGNLRQKDWKEVADAVNARVDGVRHRKTDVQCKNRIDTLKKKYKVEKAKTAPSTWPFYSRLDRLIGSAVKPIPAKPSAAAFSHPNSFPAIFSGGGGFNSSGSSRGRNDEEDEEEDEDDLGYDGARKHRRKGDLDPRTVRELARAIVRFGEIYERIESSKQQQMLELERQRMEFTKELEFQRMQMFMEAQLELEKIKRSKYNSGTSGKKL